MQKAKFLLSSFKIIRRKLSSPKDNITTNPDFVILTPITANHNKYFSNKYAEKDKDRELNFTYYLSKY